MLSEAQRREYMDVLRRAFSGNDTVHIDGWCSERGQSALAFAARQGWCTTRETRESQYTAINYTVTPAGRAALEEADG